MKHAPSRGGEQAGYDIGAGLCCYIPPSSKHWLIRPRNLVDFGIKPHSSNKNTVQVVPLKIFGLFKRPFDDAEKANDTLALMGARLLRVTMRFKDIFL